MLAGQDLGRRHQGGLAAGLDGARHGEQRHHGLARADIALQQAQHAPVGAEIGADLGRARGSCAPVSAKGRAGLDPAREPAVAGILAAGAAAAAGTGEGERQLRGQELVIGEPASARGWPARCRRSRRRGAWSVGPVLGAERLGEGRQAVLPQPGRVLPFGQHRQAVEGGVGELRDRPRGQPLGGAVDRLDGGEGGEPGLVDDAGGMHHLAVPVPEVDAPGDVAVRCPAAASSRRGVPASRRTPG